MSASPMPRITPFLWFDSNAEEAIDFYLSVFPNSQKLDELRTGAAGPGPAGMILTITFMLEGQRITAMNGGPGHKFNEAFSLVVACKTQAEIDGYWEKFRDGGSEIACGWIKDRFGLCWQIVPENLAELVRHPGAMTAMMKMIKLDIPALEAAAKES